MGLIWAAGAGLAAVLLGSDAMPWLLIFLSSSLPSLVCGILLAKWFSGFNRRRPQAAAAEHGAQADHESQAPAAAQEARKGREETRALTQQLGALQQAVTQLNAKVDAFIASNNARREEERQAVSALEQHMERRAKWRAKLLSPCEASPVGSLLVKEPWKDEHWQ